MHADAASNMQAQSPVGILLLERREKCGNRASTTPKQMWE